MGFSTALTGLVAISCAVALTAANPVAGRPSKLGSRQTQPGAFCSQKAPGIYLPINRATITQNSTDSQCQDVEILYCSGQYFKTSSIDTSVWLNDLGATRGELLAQNIKPDNKDAQGGFYSYRYNVTLCPSDGSYITGDKTISVYETETGYYNAANYEIHSVNVTFVTSGEV